MSILIQIVTIVFLFFVMAISGFLFIKSGIAIKDTIKYGVDSQATVEKFKESMAGGVNLIVLKNQEAIYLDNEIIGYSRYSPSETENGFLFPTVYMQGEAKKLKDLKANDIFEYKKQKYKITDIGGPKSGNENGRYFDLMRNITATKL